MTELGDMRANDTDYGGRILIEHFNYGDRDEPFWHVPAWEERGCADLAGNLPEMCEGHFIGWSWATRALAERAIAKHRRIAA